MTAWLFLLLPLIGPADAPAPATVDPDLPFRTDRANAHLPWYQLRAGEFPPSHSEHVVDGVLTEVDFLRRSGQFRRAGDGVLVDFTMPPFGTVLYLNAEADLRDLPFGTLLHFSTYQDGQGAFTRVAAVRDEFTATARDGLPDRLVEVKAVENTLVVTATAAPGGSEGAGRRALRVDGHTRFWKGDRAVTIGDLAPGDALLVNTSGDGPCADVWAGARAHEVATEQQRARHRAFLKARGLPAWIDRVEGKALAVTLLGDPASLAALLKAEGIDPALWAAERRSVDAVVANEELRTYNPPVDRKRAAVLRYEGVAAGGHGCGGVRWVIEPDLLLEGFRKGRVIRLFAHPSWPVNDMAFGEGLYSEAPDFKPDRVDPNLYPYRTDSGNDHLPWFRPKPGGFAPEHSHHLVHGELVTVDDHGRSGRFRADGTGELVDFTMPPSGTVLYLNAEADLRDVPTGTRCRFFLHQDDRGAFTRAAVVADEFERLAGNGLNYRLVAARPDDGVLLLATQHAPVKNDKEEMIRPPDFGRVELAVDDRTRVWKGDQRVSPRDLAVGDELLLNTTGRTATGRGVCTDIWVGVDTHKRATARQREAHNALLKGRGLPALINRVEGKALTITFIAASRRDFPALLDGDPNGGSVYALLADEELRPVGGPAVKSAFLGHPPEEDTAGTYGCSGVCWRIEPSELLEGVRPGRALLVFKEGWPIKAGPPAP